MDANEVSLKIKVKISLSTARRRIRGVDLQLQTFLTPALESDEWLNSRPGRFTPGKVRDTH